MRSVLSTYEVKRDGPYLRVVIPEVLPPDWDALHRDLACELEEGGIERVSIVTPHFSYDRTDRDALTAFLQYLADEQVDICIEWRDQEA